MGGTAPVETIPSGTSGAPIIDEGGVPADEAYNKERKKIRMKYPGKYKR
jgi:hypothetical protein